MLDHNQPVKAGYRQEPQFISISMFQLGTSPHIETKNYSGVTGYPDLMSLDFGKLSVDPGEMRHG